MFDPFTLSLIAGGVSAVGAVSSWWGKQTQADRIRQETEEQVRRQRLADAQKLSMATAAGAASGVEFGSTSLQLYLKAMKDEMQRQQDWTLKAGKNRANDLGTAADIGLFTDLGAGLFRFGGANNWWRS